MNLISGDLNTVITLADAFIDEIEPSPLVQLNRTVGGQYYASALGLDEVLKIKARITDRDTYNKIRFLIKRIISINGLDNNDNVDYSGSYVLDKLKIKKFSSENNWWHVEMELKNSTVLKPTF